MVSVASLLNHVPSETTQRIQLPPSPMSTSSSHYTNGTSPTITSASTSPRTNASSSTLNRLVHNSSAHQANGQISEQTSNTSCRSSNNFSNTSNPGPGGLGQVKKQKMSKDGAVFVKGKIKGEVNFPPFENLDEITTAEVLKFHVYPLGKITEYCRHIPYNSEKKTFLEKTGRESFEVFQYVFRVPDDEKDYTVMWDYNTGLVRITPFFKCCKFTKTTPAKMLNLNPGLKDITHSITGGALVAQGYWMPYSCALAVCATFCHHIAPALIPIFGPSFPSRCVVPEAPEHGRFSIDPAIVIESTKEAERFRAIYASSSGHTHNSRRSETRMLSPRSTPIEIRVTDMRDREMMDRGREREREDVRGKERERNYDRHRDYEHEREIRTPLPNSYLGKRLRLKRDFGGADSPYRSGSTDTDMEYTSESSNDRYLCSPFTPASEKSVLASGSGFDRPYNTRVTPPRLMSSETPSPFLTAIPGGRSPNFSNANPPNFHHHSQIINNLNHAVHTFPHPPPPSNSTTSSPDLQRDNIRLGDEREPARSQWRPKRRVAELDRSVDEGYDGEHEESASSGSGSDRGLHSNPATLTTNGTMQGSRAVEDGPDQNAARLLMNLSVRDAGTATTGGNTSGGGGAGMTSGIGMATSGGIGLGLRMPGLMTVGGGDGSSDFDGPRVKRRRALSM